MVVDKEVPIAVIVPEVLARGGRVSFVATGGSMWPHIRHGDIVTVAPLPKGVTPATGSVLVYLTASGKIALHRVTGHTADGTLKLKGDAQPGAPELVPAENVLGHVTSLKRNGKQINLHSTTNLIVGLAVARTGSVRIAVERALSKLIAHSRRLFIGK
jgi:hypothetical protein